MFPVPPGGDGWRASENSVLAMARVDAEVNPVFGLTLHRSASALRAVPNSIIPWHIDGWIERANYFIHCIGQREHPLNGGLARLRVQMPEAAD